MSQPSPAQPGTAEGLLRDVLGLGHVRGVAVRERGRVAEVSQVEVLEVVVKQWGRRGHAVSHSRRGGRVALVWSIVDGYLGSYAPLGLLALVGVLIVGGGFFANSLLRPRRPNAAAGKRDTYECGLDP